MLRSLLACALCAALWLIVAAVAPAAITQEGGVSISPTVVQVGALLPLPNPVSGDGKLWITAPSTLTSNTLNIGTPTNLPAASGAVYVQGGSITHNEGIFVGRGGNGRLEVTGGGQATGGVVRIGGGPVTNPAGAQYSPQGVAIVDGVGSKLRYTDLSVGASSDGQLYVTNGGVLMSGATTASAGAAIAGTTGSMGLAVVDGAGSLWQHNGSISVGQGGVGALQITNGGLVVTSAIASVGGETQGAVGSILIDGPGSRWSISNLLLGNQSQYSSGEVIVTNGAVLDQGGTGQQLRASLGQSGFGRVVVNGTTSRWIHPSAPRVGSSNGGTGEIVLEDGTQFTSGGIDLQNGRVLVDGPTTRWTSTTPINFGNSQLYSATIELRNGATLNMPQSTQFTIGPSGRLLLGGGRVISPNTRGTLTNNGLIQGGGALQVGPLTNKGRVLIGAGEKLQIAGQFTNLEVGVIEVNNGELEIESFASNVGGRLIASGATLRATPISRQVPGWQGKGAFTFAAGRNRVFGAYTQSTTVVASGAQVEFYDAVTNIGPNAMSVAAGGKLMAFSSFSGNGVGGAGDVFLEGQVQPGNTAADTMAFGGDVFLGGASRLAIQVGGVGGRFDSLVAHADVSLSGALQLAAIGELSTPTAMLPIVQAGELSGVFSSTPAIGASIGSGIRFHGVTYDYANDEVIVSLTQGLAADFNLDGVQDGADLLVWQRALGTLCEPGMGADATCDGFVDGADLAVWQTAMAAGSGGLMGAQSGVQTAVPEPASLGLAGFAVVGLISRFSSLGRRRLFGS